MKPILFSTPMVQAIIKDRKTQTRRVIKPQPYIDKSGNLRVTGLDVNYGQDLSGPHWDVFITQKAKYQPGDILYVRETCAQISPDLANPEWVYAADKSTNVDYWNPSIHMPKDAARIFLKITAVRAERLQDITEADAIAEGIENMLASDPTLEPIWYKYDVTKSEAMAPGGHWAHCADGPIQSFQSLWQSIYGPESWDANPWVFAYTFERCDRPQSETVNPKS